MDAILGYGLVNAAIASLFALVAMALTGVWRNPYVARAVWLIVLLRFIAPPLFTYPLPFQEFADDIQTRIPDIASLGRTGIAPELPALDSETDGPVSRSTGAFHAPARASEPNDRRSGSDAVMKQPGPRTLLCGTTGIWLIGTAWVAGVALRRTARFGELLRHTVPPPARLQQLVERVAKQAGVTRRVRVRMTSAKLTPLVWSLGSRATIVLPTALLSRLSDAKTEAILAHELMHIRRRDGAIRWLEFLVVSLYWWCPFAWIVRRKVQTAEEHCCDSDVLRRFPRLRGSYAAALLETLEYLSERDGVVLGATGFARRAPTTRRFEMIVNFRGQSRPAVVARTLTLIAAIALIGATPDAKSSEDTTKTTAAGISDACTIILADGAELRGRILSLDDDRVVVASDPQGASTTLGSSGVEFAKEVLELSLHDSCVLAIANGARVEVKPGPDGVELLVPPAGSGVSVTDARGAAERTVRDVEAAYRRAWLAYRNLAVVKSGRDRALATWRSVQERPEGADADEEAAIRAQYFRCRGEIDRALSAVNASESSLRKLVGLAAADGRTIRPTDPPESTHVRFTFDAVREHAMLNRVEMQRQAQVVERRTAALNKAKANHGDRTDQESQSELRHLELLLVRDQAIANDLKLEVSHQLGDALRDVDLTWAALQTNKARAAAAQKERDAVGEAFERGVVSIYLLIDSQSREVEAARAANEARVEYADSLSQVHRAKGTLLTHRGFGFDDAE